MAPRTANPESADGKADGKHITVLCTLIMSCQDFKADMSKAAEALGITHAKNV